MKHSKGPWSFSPMRGQIGHCTMAQVWDDEGSNLCSIDSRYGEDMATANAELISKAPEMKDILNRIYKESIEFRFDAQDKTHKFISEELFKDVKKLLK